MILSIVVGSSNSMSLLPPALALASVDYRFDSDRWLPGRSCRRAGDHRNTHTDRGVMAAMRTKASQSTRSGTIRANGLTAAAGPITIC